MSKQKHFLDGNTVYIIWFLFYFWLTSFGISLIVIRFDKAVLIAAAIYALTLSFAFTPAGEKLFKIMNGIRPLYTNREKEKIVPIVREVHTDIMKKIKSGKHSVEICISDSLIPNAYAMGEKTIVVTKGLIESMTEEQIKGILAHEFGHLNHGDTKAVVFTFIGNGILNVTALCIRKIFGIIFKVTEALSQGMICTVIFGLFGGVFHIAQLIFETALFVIQLGGELILMAKSRRDELCADYYAYKMNYGEELVSALYDLELMASGRTLSIMEQLRASHPHIAKRIGSLET